jgi:hypothetical protein
MPTDLRNVFDELKALHKNGDPIRAHLTRIADRDRAGHLRKKPLEFNFGKAVASREVILMPLKEPRSFFGPELTEAILHRYNEEYWLVALWNSLLENARESRIATDLVRAFIRHAIFLTGEEFLGVGRTIDSAYVTENGLRKQTDYYRRLFRWGEITQCMRLSEKRAVFRRLRCDHSAIKAFRLRELNTVDILRRLPEINEILGWADLPLITRDAKEQTQNLQPILRWIYLNWHFWRDSKKLRTELARVLEFNQPINYRSI